MKIRRFFSYIGLSVLTIILLVGNLPAQDKEALDNNTIIKMVRAGVGENIIIGKIKDSKPGYNLSAEELIKLKTAGVSDGLLGAMQQAMQLHAGHTSEVAAVPLSGDGFIMQGGKPIEIDYVLGFMKIVSGLSFKTRFVVIADEEHAQLQIKDRNPLFYIRSRPELIDVVKFDWDTYNKKPVRYVLFMQNVGDSRANTKMGKDFEYKKEANGLYKISFKTPLENGEYGIIVSPGQGESSARIYDFAVVD